MVKVITGIRRCGKTYLLRTLFYEWLLKHGVPTENIIFIALDKNENAKYRNPILLDEYLHAQIQKDKGKCICMIDEIQYCVSVPNEALPASAQTKDTDITFYDTVLGLMSDCDLYITGSNSHMLSSDILTNFRGRGDEIRVHPLSYAEFVSAWKGKSEDAFREYLLYGGLPMVLTSCSDSRDKGTYLKNLFEKIYITDIVERYHIKSVDDMNRIIDCLASSTGSFVNPTNIANKFGNGKMSVARNTVAEYIRYAEEAFLVAPARRFDIRGKEYVTGQQKYYFTDLGLRNARLSFRQYDRPHLLENAVYNELIIRGYSVDVGRVQMGVKNANGDWQVSYAESDFVVNSLDDRMYIQVAEGIDDPGKKDQELLSLRHIRDGFPKYLLIDQDVPTHYTEEGFRVMSIQEFLLNAVKY